MPALYMESFSDAAKGKVKAAEREAEKKKKKEKEDTQQQPCTRNEVLQQRLQRRTSLAGPARLRPNALARLQQRACAPPLRAGPFGRLQQRACARSLRATRATGLRAWGRTQGGAHFGGLRQVQRCQWAFQNGGLAACWLCKEGHIEHGVWDFSMVNRSVSMF